MKTRGTNNKLIPSREKEELVQYAISLGATDARMISAKDISIENHLAAICKESACENYGLAMSCPPHVSGPSGFRNLLTQFEHALVFKMDVLSEHLFSHQRLDIFRLLHEIASGVQRKAVLMGFSNAKGFAGGSCKMIFCLDQKDCNVVAHGGPCRNPLQARPSMSGFGVNVSKLMETAGWVMNRASSGGGSDNEAMAPVSGLVLIS
ncbi:MAG: DUF2284 domain-containing protein [Proteobacteria bacterium]|nr:DUF2284 domain-containing protein [Pseudomonadota bacterium]